MFNELLKTLFPPAEAPAITQTDRVRQAGAAAFRAGQPPHTPRYPYGVFQRLYRNGWEDASFGWPPTQGPVDTAS